MDTKKLLNLVLIILIPVVLIVLVVSNIATPKIGNYKTRILVEQSYSNYAWGNTYNGMAICEDGTIYKWNMNDKYFKEIYNNVSDTDFGLNYESKKILKYSKKQITKVSQKDMETLRESINNLNSYMTTKNSGADMGNHAIIVWDYSKGKTITIKQSGDFEGENNSLEAQNIIKIVNKYL